MKNLLETLKGIYSFYTMVLVVFCGLFALVIEQKIMMKNNLKKEAKTTKIAGLTYVVGGIVVYFLLNIFV